MTIAFYSDESEISNGAMFRRHTHNGSVVEGTLDELMGFDGRDSEASEAAEADIGYELTILRQIGEGEDAYCDKVAYAAN